MKMETAKARTMISDEKFVIFWQKANNAQEVADHFSLKRSSVIQRACTLRSKLVPLKKFPRVNTGRTARPDGYYVDLAELAGEHGDTCNLPEIDNEETSTDED